MKIIENIFNKFTKSKFYHYILNEKVKKLNNISSNPSLYLILISLIFIIFIFTSVMNYIDKETTENLSLMQIISGHYKYSDIIQNEEYNYNIITYEDKKLKKDQLLEKWRFDNSKKELIYESINPGFNVTTIFSENLKLIYKKTEIHENSQIEIIKFIDNKYIIEKYKDGILKDEKKLNMKEDDRILTDLLPIVIRMFVVNENYKNKNFINFNLGFLQTDKKFPVKLKFKEVKTIYDFMIELKEIDLELDKIIFNQFKVQPSILFTIDLKDTVKLLPLKILYMYSKEKPYFQSFAFFGSNKNYFLLLLNNFINNY